MLLDYDYDELTSSRWTTNPSRADEHGQYTGRWFDLAGLGRRRRWRAPWWFEFVPSSEVRFSSRCSSRWWCCPGKTLVDSGSAVTLLSEWFVMVELGYELDVLLALRQSEDIIGPSGEPLELVGALETDLVFREMDRWQSVWVVRGMECDCLVGRDVLLGCKIISDDAVFFTLCIACTAVSFVFGCRRTRSLRIWIGMMRLEAEDQIDHDALLVHVPFDRGRLHFYFFFLSYAFSWFSCVLLSPFYNFFFGFGSSFLLNFCWDMRTCLPTGGGCVRGHAARVHTLTDGPNTTHSQSLSLYLLRIFLRKVGSKDKKLQIGKHMVSTKQALLFIFFENLWFFFLLWDAFRYVTRRAAMDPALSPFTHRLRSIEQLLAKHSVSTKEVASTLGTGVSAVDAVSAAIFVFLKCHGDSFEDLVEYAISLGGDTDTIATMAAAIAGGVCWRWRHPKRVVVGLRRQHDRFTTRRQTFLKFTASGSHHSLRRVTTQHCHCWCYPFFFFFFVFHRFP